MKFLSSQINYFLTQGQMRRNLKALVKYIVFLFAVIAAYTVLFHLIMLYAEGREFSWITGLYWTLTVMSTLGFGDITFSSDVGRAFTIVVLLSGIVLLLIMLPFAFIRFFYAPWIEATLRVRCPREAPPDIKGHVVICRYDTIAANLIKRLRHRDIPYFVIEPDPDAALQLFNDGIFVVNNEVDSTLTYNLLRVQTARAIVANADDATNTNITLTVREIAPDIPVFAVAENGDSIDILELAGATRVLPFKRLLGENLANRINANGKRVHFVRKLDDLNVVEFTVNDTPLESVKIKDAGIRERSGANIVGVWERGVLRPTEPEKVLGELSVPVCVGTAEQVKKLEELLCSGDRERPAGPVLVIGGGKVGRAAARALHSSGVPVHIVDRSEALCKKLESISERVTIGDAADIKTITRAGINESSLVILSTNDDAINIYLAVYCRRLNPDVRIVSRATHERNREAMHRAGADFVLSYANLGAETILSLILGRDPVLIGGGVEFFTVRLPHSLVGLTLAESGIGALTGLIVLAIDTNGEKINNPPPSTVLAEGAKLTLLGTTEQWGKFNTRFD